MTAAIKFHEICGIHFYDPYLLFTICQNYFRNSPTYDFLKINMECKNNAYELYLGKNLPELCQRFRLDSLLLMY